MIGLIGPDGVGKSTLMGLIAGAKRLQTGHIEALGGDMSKKRHRADAGSRIAFMPQGLGRNLYHDLTLQENLDFFGKLFGLNKSERKARIDRLTQATGLDAFMNRPAGKLSGGMKQKLGLCAALIHDPDFLLLDEPTTGVDPLSRSQFWDLIDTIRADRPQMSVLVSTAYMEEAARFGHLVAMNNGLILASGSPDELLAQTTTGTVGAAYVALLNGESESIPESLSTLYGTREIPDNPPHSACGGLMVKVNSLTTLRESGKSDELIVPQKQPNKGLQGPAEAVVISVILGPNVPRTPITDESRIT